MEHEVSKSSATCHGGSGGNASGLPPLPPTTSVEGLSSSRRHSLCSFGTEAYEILSRISEFPDRKNIRHRRVHSEIVSLPDPEVILNGDFSTDFSIDVGYDGAGGNAHSLSDISDEEDTEDLVSMYINFDKFSSSTAYSSLSATGSAASSISMSSLSSASAEQQPQPLNSSLPTSRPSTRIIRHHRSKSLDGTVFIKPDDDFLFSDAVPSPQLRRAMSPAEIAELALTDPKRAKRVLANRQSAARSKQRKLYYIAALEHEAGTLERKKITLATKVVMLKKGNSDVATENHELEMQLLNLEQRKYVQDALTSELNEELWRLKWLAGEIIPKGASVMQFSPSYVPNQQSCPSENAVRTFLAEHQLQQLQIHSQQQQQQTGDKKIDGSKSSPTETDHSTDVQSSCGEEE